MHRTESSLLSKVLYLYQVTSEDIDTGTHMAKVIAITGDLSSHHNSLGDQTGSLANMTVKFHLDEAGNVQVIYIFQYYY